ncbi:hypothetical protein COL87_28925 [Bacillus pseudomycoides]|uniref:Uncharacterized protein n=1 Tax=Bacillus pseudomycoides TaxID=64104 RepID=A0A2C4EQJ3_9BACI|nr:hypothetical protein [Bacillus pseudomycoides]PDY10405.1 hypothetical protein COO16_20880 [Bacillus pseudomycoides]PEE04460.1 hypothetical protein CON86_19945 [Bacillus pseudomycoides]PEF72888.1 hypothetical protein CON94_24090 [Bacillus pseudomycoides]PEI42980.1 hypothetical protein CN641_19590 [Bacillus pseudomycoides]
MISCESCNASFINCDPTLPVAPNIHIFIFVLLTYYFSLFFLKNDKYATKKASPTREKALPFKILFFFL